MAFLQKKIIIIVIVLVLLKQGLIAQSSANGTVSATVTELIGASKVSNTNDNIPCGSRESVTAPGASNSNVNGNIKIIKPGESTCLASFNIIGNEYGYSVTHPLSVILQRKSGNQKIEIALFNFIHGSDQIMDISAWLKVANIGGVYSPLVPVDITINYD